MPKSLPPLSWFRAFESAARHLSFTAAAAELGLTQSAISQQVRSLELRFGAPLFTRLPRGLALADTGRRLLPDVADAIANLTRATETLAPAPMPDTLVVASSISFSQHVISRGLATFLADHPDTQIRMISTLWRDEFALTDADVEIRFGPDLKGDDAQQLSPDHLVLVCAPNYLGSPVDWAHIRAAGLIRTTGTTDSWESWAKALELPPPDTTRQTVDSYGLAIDLARAGSGVALTSLLLAAPYLASGELVIPLKRRMIAKDQFSINAEHSVQNPLARAFVAWILGRVVKAQQSAEELWRAL